MAQIALAAPVSLKADSVPTTAPARASTPRGRLELTRRGRFILIGLPVMLAATALLVLAGIFTAPVMASDASDTTAVEATTVSVMEGDTVWALAEEFAPQRDRRDVMAEITEMNDLNGSVLVPGQEIFVPTGD
ncbi:MAG: LysM peptidoglycan-binding domain-containing protein [Arthrobacter sp.]|uniref:LysM peptidoglycan-binding domain-containing protein n=1 Tax=Arthrobacter sp. AOP36-A1-22 TaxID=3457684 RepID=UPI00264D7E2E|nr:LysM peptidoglycan-binding domain-containing protein [Micrococcaceae bacterium]MDN5905619.1 LysM peptidoglycan-binding domain-containing protein [Micrococcaceae bacterium]